MDLNKSIFSIKVMGTYSICLFISAEITDLSLKIFLTFLKNMLSHAHALFQFKIEEKKVTSFVYADISLETFLLQWYRPTFLSMKYITACKNNGYVFGHY